MIAAQMLPPSSRDFEIHRLSLIEHLSTRRLAELNKISQTRVRQIVFRVCQWLAANLPVPTEAELEQEKRLAMHLAAAALQHQIEQLQTLFDATYDPKYLRQQNRSMLALARLGTLPGAIDSLAADITDAESSQHTPCAEPLPDAQDRFAVSPIQNPISPIPNSLPPPPPEDCSPSPASHPLSLSPTPPLVAPTLSPASPSAPESIEFQPDPEGLNLIERRLLTLIDETSAKDADRLASLRHTLANIRREQAALELRIAPPIVGAAVITPPPSAADHFTTHTVP